MEHAGARRQGQAPAPITAPRQRLRDGSALPPRVAKSIDCVRRCISPEAFAARCGVKLGTAWSYIYDAANRMPLDAVARYVFEHVEALLLVLLYDLAETEPTMLEGPLTPLVRHCSSVHSVRGDKYGVIRLARHFVVRLHAQPGEEGLDRQSPPKQNDARTHGGVN